jgi:hypothetical protein
MAGADFMSMDTQDKPSSSDTIPSLRIEATLAPSLNLAFHQNAVPVLRELMVINDQEAALDGIELTLSSDPPFLVPKTWRIDSVPAGQRFRVPKLDVSLNGTLLSRLTEAETATAHLVRYIGRRAYRPSRYFNRAAGPQPMGRHRAYAGNGRRFRATQ